MPKKNLANVSQKEVSEMISKLLKKHKRTTIAHYLQVTEPNISKWHKSGKITEENWEALQSVGSQIEYDEKMAEAEADAIEASLKEKEQYKSNSLQSVSTETLVDELQRRGWQVELKKS